MGAIAKTVQVSSEKDILDGWDPRLEDYLNSQSSTVNCEGPGANFSRTANLARCKEMVREPCGVYVRNVPCTMSSEGLSRLFSEYGKVLSVFVGKPREEFLKSGITWAIVKVASMRDAMTMISALDHKSPMNLRVELAMTDEERGKRRRERDLQKAYDQMVDERVTRVTKNEPPLASPQLNPTHPHQVSLGRGKMISLKHKKNDVAFGQPGKVNFNTKQGITASAVTNDDSAPSVTQCQPRGNKDFVEIGNGTVVEGWKPPRPCISCKNDGKLRCSVCKAWYCSKECQVDDWYYHRHDCIPPPPLEEPCNQVESVGETVTVKDQSPLLSDSMRADGKESILTQFSASYFSDQTQKAASPQETAEKVSSPDAQLLQNSINNETVKESHHMQLKNCESVNQSDNNKLPENLSYGSNTLPNTLKQKVMLCRKNLQSAMSKVRDTQKLPVGSSESHEIKPQLASTCTNRKSVRLTNPILRSGQLRRPFDKVKSSVGQTANDNSKESTEAFVSSRAITDMGKANAERNVFDSGNLKLNCHPESAVLNEKMPLNKTSLTYCNTEDTPQNLRSSSSMIPSLHPHSSTAGKQSNGSSELMESLQNTPCVLDDLKLDNEYNGVVMLVEDDCMKFTALVLVDAVKTVVFEGHEVLASVPQDPTFKPVVGSRVAAVSSFDNTWCRAYVYKIEGEKFHVFFIDFGNMETVHVVKPLPAGPFSELPGLAFIAKVHSKVTPEIQQQLQTVITVNTEIKFKVVGKKSKSLKVLLLQSCSDSVITDFILRPWYFALPLPQDSKMTISRTTPGHLAKFDVKPSAPEANFCQDRPVDDKSNKINSEQIPLNSSSKANLTKHTGFVPLSAQRSVALKSSCPIGERAKNVPSVNVLEQCSLKNQPDNVRGQKFIGNESLKIKDNKSSLLSLPPKTSTAREKFWARDLGKIELKCDHDYKVLPVSVDAENHLYVHIVTNKSIGDFQQLMESITVHCETGTAPSDLEVGELVCGFVVGDGQWYRGEVVKIVAELVTLLLVDFGYEESVLLVNVREFSANFMKFPCVCVKVKLHNVSKDDSEAQRKISELIKSSPQLIMYCRRKDCFEFHLFDVQNNVVLNDELSSHKRTPVYQETSSAASSLLVRKLPQEDINAANKCSSSSNITNFQSSTNPLDQKKSFPKTGPFSPRNFPESKKLSIPTDSVSSVKQNTPEKLTMEARLTTSPATDLIHSMANKNLCNPSSASNDTPSSAIQLTNPKAIVQQNNECDSFTIPTRESKGIGRKVPMYDTCKSTVLPIAKGVEVVLMEVSDALSIFVIPKASLFLFDELEDMTTSITNYCESRPNSLYRPKIGEMCLGKFSEDGKWYRAACLEPRLESAFVIFVDFGNMEDVPNSNLRPMEESFLELPCLALHCLLDGVSGKNIKEAAKPRLHELLPALSVVEVDVLEHCDDGTYVIAIPKVLEALISEDLLE
ncbi:tudor domain-containing protein 1 isoform X2 [Procambarus clarkii]|uniref:tudor domain-containing protein 1 isoform X2 n=1 Tax=Procambarus clarkii TaxID=6728 RepID=UPI003743C619